MLEWNKSVVDTPFAGLIAASPLPETLPEAPPREPETEPERVPAEPRPDLDPFEPDWPDGRPEPKPIA